LAGITLARTASFSWQAALFVGLAAVLAFVLYRDSRRVRLGAACALALALGAGRLLLAAPRFDETSLATYNEAGWVTLEGVVVRDPDEPGYATNLCVEAEWLALPDGIEREIEGLVLVQARSYPERHYGDRVRVEGLLETPPILETFSYRDYLARQGIHSLVPRAHVTLLAERQANPLLHTLYAFRRHARSTIASILPEPQAALLTGILLGVETGIPDDVMDDFGATGTTHIIAISGFNLTIVSTIFAGLARRFFGQRRATWIAIAGVAIYTLLVGASAAVVRAAVMGVLTLLALHLGRSTYAPISLAVAAVGMTAWNPYTLWDVGFQLSFAATVGLVAYAEPMEKGVKKLLTRVISAERAQWLLELISEGLLVTLAAQITTTPLLLATFGRLSLVTLLSNLLILPVQPQVMIFGGVAALLGLVFRPLGQVAGWVAWVFLTYTIEAVRITAQVPYASVPVRVESWMVVAYYALLGAGTWWLARRRGDGWQDDDAPPRRDAPPGRLYRWGGAVALVLVFAAWRALPDGRLRVAFLDVGQGDAIFVQTPSGRQVLIDGGPSEAQLLAQLGRQMPFWDRTLDVMVLTHPDSDHVTGLIPVLERYRVGVVVHRELGVESEEYATWLALVAVEGAEVHRGEAGLRLALDDGVEMVVLHPGTEPARGTEADPNNNSVVMRLTYGQASLLLTGDAEAVVEERLVAEGKTLASTVLKAAHHGSCGSTTPAFLDAVDPEVVVVSVGADNHFGHPCEELLARLGDLPLYRTDEQGAVEVISDGTRMWVEVQRGD
jgi:competence protein ComEC